MASLTATQFNILVWLNEQGDRVLYGPMSNGFGGMGGRGTYGFSGGGPASTIRILTGDKLKAMGLIRHIHDKYPLGYYAITDEGRAAVSKTGGR